MKFLWCIFLVRFFAQPGPWPVAKTIGSDWCLKRDVAGRKAIRETETSTHKPFFRFFFVNFQENYCLLYKIRRFRQKFRLRQLTIDPQTWAASWKNFVLPALNYHFLTFRTAKGGPGFPICLKEIPLAYEKTSLSNTAELHLITAASAACHAE